MARQGLLTQNVFCSRYRPPAVLPVVLRSSESQFNARVELWCLPRFARAAAAAAGAAASTTAARRGRPAGRSRDLRSARVVACSAGDGSQEGQILTQVVEAFPDGAAQWVSLGDARRMLVATEGSSARAVKKLKEAVRWKAGTLDSWLAAEAETLKSAETRVIGIGRDSRPLVYSGCVNQRPGEEAGIILACVWDLALQEAGPEAKLDYVLDAHGYQPLLNLNVMPYLKVARSIDSYFAERFHKIVIMDVPRVLVWLIKQILRLMPDKTRQKVVFVSRSDAQQMQAVYDLCADEDMRRMMEELFRLNGLANSRAGREATHELTNSFLAAQRLRK